MADYSLTLTEAAAELPGFSATRLGAENRTPRPAPNFIYGNPDERSLRFFQGDTYELATSVYVGREVQVDGPWFDIGALLSHDGVQMICPELALDPRRDVALAQQEATRLSLATAARRLRRVPGQALLFATNGHLGFGHWLVDFLPKLYLCDQAGIDLSKIKVLLPSNMGDFGLQFLRIFGFSEWQILRYNPDSEVLVVQELVIPTLMRWGGRTAPGFFDAVQFLHGLIDRHNQLPDMPGLDRVFVKRVQPPGYKPVHNRDAVEQIVLQAGLKPFLPERHSVLEQIAVFRRARYMFGEYGSTLHTAMFSRPGAVVGCIHQPLPVTFDALQSGISERMHLITGYIFAQADDTGDIVVDPAEVTRCLATFFTV
ncbi:MAG: glycosyltransferase family 61 protein [Acetobacteraceae bacterium]|nr:glycosyltransferase family 61 protein [Acetobacteraceae bacterium]